MTQNIYISLKHGEAIGAWIRFWSFIQGRIQDSPYEGRQLLQGVGANMILPNFPKNCMKLRKFWAVGGHAP